MPKKGHTPNLPNPGLSYKGGINIASRNTSSQDNMTSQHTMDANRLAKVPSMPSEGKAPMSNHLQPLPLP